jgi:dethiobiotin synthetase
MFEWNQNFRYPPRFVVTGTDTGVGKTVISTLLTLHLGGTYWKPIQAGISPSTDRDFVLQEGGIPLKRVWKEAYLFERPISPHLASKAEGVNVSFDRLMVPPLDKEPLIIEGVGGVMTPLTDETLFIDLLKFWNFPVVVVARSTLGTINHTLLTLEALRSRKIPVLGLFFNGPGNKGNRDSIEKIGKVEILGEMYPVDDLRQYCETVRAEASAR